MRRAKWLAVSGLALMAAAAPVAASPMDDLAGHWTGVGSVYLANGSSERVKCAVTYKVAPGGAQVKQNLRCASSSYAINVSADLRVANRRISGNWEEKTYSTSGSVSGLVTDRGMALAIKGSAFSAAMNVSLSNCRQSINIAPHGLDVQRISIGLGKC